MVVERWWSSNTALSLSFVLAWIYTVLPCNDYWLYFLVKNQFWGILNLTLVVELYAFHLPELADWAYVTAYVLGFSLAPLTHIIRYAVRDGRHQMEVSAVANAFLVLTTMAVFAYDVFSTGTQTPTSTLQQQHNNHHNPSTEEGQDSNREDSTVMHQCTTESVAYRCMIEATGFITAAAGDHHPQQGKTLEEEGEEMRDVEMTMSPLQSSTVDSAAAVSPVVSCSTEKGGDVQNGTGRLSAAYSSKSWSYYFFFLPRYLLSPQHLHSNHTQPRPNTKHYYQLFVATTVFIILYNLNYTFLIYFTKYFRRYHTSDHNNGQEDFHQIALFFLYIAIGTVFRMAMKSCGMFLDRHFTQKSFSMYFIGETMAVMFYYTFYRVLFESMHNVWEFVVFQCLHLCSEWTLYVFRSHPWYFHHSEQYLQQYCPKILLVQPRITHRHWMEFMALDFGIRCVIFIGTGYGMILLLVMIQYLPWVHSCNDLVQSNAEFQMTCILILVAVICESLNAYAMNEFYFKRHQFDILHIVNHCFTSIEFSILAVLIGANLYINPIFAFTTVHFSM